MTGTVTTPLPATMAAGAIAPFKFTYTNNNNGTVTNVVSLGPTINPNPGGSGMFVPGSVHDTCATLPGVYADTSGVRAESHPVA